MITGILSTFAPDRYAVLNGNTAAALRSLGVEAQVTLTVSALRGQRYAKVVVVMAELRERIGAADFLETDAFLNWLYQRLEEPCGFGSCWTRSCRVELGQERYSVHRRTAA